MSTLLEIDRSWEAALPRSEGAFDWWYVDARTPDGDALVFIFARALPFFPREGPSVNVALVRRGRPVLWLLEHHKEQVVRTGEGRFTVEVGGSTLRVDRIPGALDLRARVDLAVPGDRRRLTGTIAVRGPAAFEGEASRHPHRWAPLCPVATVRARFDFGGVPHFALDAPGYLDRNLADAPLDALGVDRWTWGRARDGVRCAIWYALEGPSGSEEHRLDFDGTLVRAGANREVALGARIESGPFYSRWLAEAGGMPAIVERCEATRIHDRWHRPLVRMRQHRDGERDSFWAPLFCGPAEGRFKRLLRVGGRT